MESERALVMDAARNSGKLSVESGSWVLWFLAANAGTKEVYGFFLSSFGLPTNRRLRPRRAVREDCLVRPPACLLECPKALRRSAASYLCVSFVCWYLSSLLGMADDDVVTLFC